MEQFKRTLKRTFLPNGYPQTVSNDYLRYQFWDSFQAFASSMMNNLATQAVFKGVGVGDANATVLAATITWILKDGTSLIGSLIFATLECTRMDSDCKQWRLFADLINDLAILLDLFSAVLPRFYFTTIQCLSGLLRSIVGIAGGATRAALTQHQAKCNNMADVSAKDNSQERMVNLFALIFSLILLPCLSDQQLMIWPLFVAFTVSHIYFNYRAVKTVSINVFNAKRFAIFLDLLFASNDSNLSVDYVNQKENVWLFIKDKHDLIFKNVRFRLCSQLESNQSKNLFEISNVLTINHQTNEIHVSLLKDDCSKAIQQSFDTVLVLKTLLLIFFVKKLSNNTQQDEQRHLWQECFRDIIKNKYFDLMMEHIEKNQWLTSHLLMAELFQDEISDNENKKYF